MTLLEVENLSRTYRVRSGVAGTAGSVRAVRDVSLTVSAGETLGVVGESGSGKSTLGRLVSYLERPTSGSVRVSGIDLSSLSASRLAKARRHVQVVFQDPLSSLDPRMSVRDIVAEPLVVHRIGSRRDRAARVDQLLTDVGLGDGFGERYPHELSGGQRQRVAVARALALGPDLIVCDEPTSALDVSVQSQILNLLLDLQARTGVSYLFISHNMDVVRHMADRVAVMYKGELVELSSTADLYEQALHPYTQFLFSAIPVPDPAQERQRKRLALRTERHDDQHEDSRCGFAARCPLARQQCVTERPGLREVEAEHWVRCHLAPDESRIAVAATHESGP